MTSRELGKLAGEIRELLARVPAAADGLSTRQARTLRGELAEVATKLRERIARLDPTRQPDSFFDPLDPRLFGLFAAIALIGQDRLPLASMAETRFYGSGVYALYYTGSFAVYKPIKKTEHPIYVGKARPQGKNARTPVEQGEKLCGRLNDHRKNISKATKTLRVADFACRYLVVQSGYEAPAESALIDLFSPIWNGETRILYGFGKHGDSADTRGNKRSPWDTLHPGRAWAGHRRLEDARSVSEIKSDVREHFERHPPVRGPQHVLHDLVAQIRNARPSSA